MKQLKEIFGRKTSIWLSLELVLVTFACWWAFDPVIVTSYVTNLPLGYDPDRLVRFEVASTLPTQQLFTTQIPIGLEEESLLHKVQEMDGVEMAYRAFNNPIGSGITSMAYHLIRDNDTLRVTNYGFGRDDKMFEVFGIQSLTPEVPTAELTRDAVFEQTVILTRSTAMALYGTTDVAGRTVKAHYYGYNPDKMDYEWMVKDLPIRAVVEDVRYGVYDRDYTILFVCQGAPGINVPIIARLREGVDAQRFMEEHQHEVQHDLMTEHCYVSQMQTVREGAKAYTDRYRHQPHDAPQPAHCRLLCYQPRLWCLWHVAHVHPPAPRGDRCASRLRCYQVERLLGLHPRGVAVDHDQCRPRLHRLFPVRRCPWSLQRFRGQ